MDSRQIVASDKVSSSFASDDEVSMARRTLGRTIERANTVLAIHFTPRSGSSWLSSVLESTGRMGTGLELFNSAFMPDIAKVYGARSFAEYIDMARYFSSQRGVLSFEITSHQLMEVFRNTDDFFRIFDGCPSYWLIREDIVSQAVSLAKMVKTGISHAPQSNLEKRNLADETFTYDGDEILGWLKHILEAERNSEKFFAEYGVQPFRISYEKLISKDVSVVLSEISRFAGLPEFSASVDPKSEHKKIGTEKNYEFAEKFNHDYGVYLKDVAQERSVWLEKLY